MRLSNVPFAMGLGLFHSRRPPAMPVKVGGLSWLTKKQANYMTKQGWISLHRKLEDNPIFQNEKALKIWIWLLLRANHEPNDVLIGRQLVHLKMGQFIFGSDIACERLKMSKSTIHWWLDYLKVERYIERKTTNRYSVITVLNYEMYQTVERQVEYRRNAKRTPSVQPNETNNKENTVNTENTDNKRIQKFSSQQDITLPVMNEIAEKYHVPLSFVQSKFDDMSNWMAAKGKVYKDYKAALSNWVKSDALKIAEKERQAINKFQVTKV